MIATTPFDVNQTFLGLRSGEGVVSYKDGVLTIQHEGGTSVIECPVDVWSNLIFELDMDLLKRGVTSWERGEDD